MILWGLHREHLGSSGDGRLELLCANRTLEAVSVTQYLNQENDRGIVQDNDRFEKHF